MKFHWETPKLIVEPDSEIEWMSTSAGAAAAMMNSDEIQVYMTGRDLKGRSNVGLIRLSKESCEVIEIKGTPELSLGEPGSFDQNGISYPCLLELENRTYLYYTGWIEGVQVRWYNGVGLAIRTNGGAFTKSSRSPIFHRTNEDFIGFGSTYVFTKDSQFIAIATRFESWDETGKNHHYNLKAGTSKDGINFEWEESPIFPFKEGEFAIAKPCVLRVNKIFLMWYSYRGSAYKIGLAASRDGLRWTRFDNLFAMKKNENTWCNEMQCYPYVIEVEERFIMFFNGNGYGRTGLGFSWMKRECMEALVAEISELIE
jgi:hypothetical protein